MKLVLAYIILAFSIQAVVYAAEPANTADGQEVQDKISGTQICAKPERAYNIPVSNQSKRLYSISQMKCTWTHVLRRSEKRGGPLQLFLTFHGRRGGKVLRSLGGLIQLE